jgi:hypothetical protein
MPTQMNRRQVLGSAFGVSVAAALYGPGAGLAHGGKTRARYRWDLVKLGLPGPVCVTEGGAASSRALDGARITLTGSGTFRDGRECSRKVTGGGTWTITPGTAPTPLAGSGTYSVVEFVSWTPAPGTLPVADCIGDAADVRAGRLTLTIRFSDGSEGVLEIGCRLPAGSPDEIMEGITVTKGFTTFWNHEEPVAGAEGNRTLFHMLRNHDHDGD